MINAWSIYPRPQLKRNSFISLNGQWDFFVQKPKDKSEVSFNEVITVPYPPESSLSGIGRRIATNEVLYYRTFFDAPMRGDSDRVILHFGAVDNHTEVSVNGRVFESHSGGYLPFSFDITEAIDAENELIVKVIDTLDHDYPYGKQRVDRGGMWYTPTSGIWQTVWLEVVPKSYIRNLKIDVNLMSATLEIDTDAQNISAEVTDELADISVDGKTITVVPKNPVLWTPENPHLYNLKIFADSDEVQTYFALRTLECKTVQGTPRMCLNGEPYYFHALLDQGYFHDGIFLPAEPYGYTRDIEVAKSLGFNTLRKHIKVEPEHFYYECDRLGMVVFQDFVNNSDYSFIRDTVLPTVGVKRLNDKYLRRSKRAKELFISHSRELVGHLYNHPSICLWTIFNEGWGQFEADRIYKMVKKWDGSRFIDATSGWFWQKESDLKSLHIYFKKIKIGRKSARPVIVSEFGGYCYAVKGHLFDEKKSYGYRNCKSLEELQRDFVDLYENQVIPFVKEGLCASVYTQISDVEEEINGVMTYDRKVVKLSPTDAMSIAKRLKI